MVRRLVREASSLLIDDPTHPYCDVPLEESEAATQKGEERSRPEMFFAAEEFHARILGAQPETVIEIQSGRQQIILMTTLEDTKRVIGVSKGKRMDAMVRDDYLNIGRIAEFERRTERKPSTPQQYGLQSDERGTVWMAEFCEGYREINLGLKYISQYPTWEVSRTVIANGWNQNLPPEDLPPETGDSILTGIVKHTLTVAHGTGLIGRPELNAGDYMWHPNRGVIIQCFRGDESRILGPERVGEQLEALIRSDTQNLNESRWAGGTGPYGTFDDSHVKEGFQQFIEEERLSGENLHAIKEAFWNRTKGFHWARRDTTLQNLFK